MAGNKVTLVFGGDADALSKAAKQAEKSTQNVADAVTKSSKDMTDASKSTSKLTTGLGHLGSATSGAMDAFDAIGGSLQAINDIQNASANRAAKLARAINDVEQAQEDFNQALRDSKQAEIDSGQAQIDLEQANLDAATALKAYNKTVKDHGKNSDEAKQAAIDLKQAQQDVTQANEDSQQAIRDMSQATIDAKTAQLDLNDANREAHPPELQKWADNLQMITPLLSAVVGVVGLVTAAQWLWNTALFASPITWIVLAIAALVAIIVLVATKTTFFQDTWRVVWNFMKDVGSWFAGPFASFFVSVWNRIVSGALWVKDQFVSAWNGVKTYATNVWDYFTSLPDKLKTAFANVATLIAAPFKAGFNAIGRAWNAGPGQLHFEIPWWVGTQLGGKKFDMPDVPTFHTGGIVSGALGSETLAVLQAGERVTAGSGSGSFDNLHVTVEMNGDGVIRVVQAEVDKRGGNVQRVLGSNRG